jgi:reverse gyrase
VAGNVKSIIDENGPLGQQAETRSNQRMNQRGLLSSSIAVGAGQSALYDAALPIAQADAQTQARAGEFNAGAQQQTSLANQNSQNQMAQFNAGETNKFVMQNVDSTTKTALANIQANYQMLMQSSGDASRLYQQMVTNAASIMSNKDMDAGAKQAAINNQVTLLNNGLNVIGQISNLNLKDLLTFETPGVALPPSTATTSATTLAAPTEPTYNSALA